MEKGGVTRCLCLHPFNYMEEGSVARRQFSLHPFDNTEGAGSVLACHEYAAEIQGLQT